MLEFLDTVGKPLCFVKFLNSQKASGLFVLFCGIVEAVELGMNQAAFSNVLVHKNTNSRDAMW